MADHVTRRKFAGLVRRYNTWFKKNDGPTWEAQRLWLCGEFRVLDIPTEQVQRIWNLVEPIEEYRDEYQNRITIKDQPETLRFLLT